MIEAVTRSNPKVAALPGAYTTGRVPLQPMLFIYSAAFQKMVHSIPTDAPFLFGRMGDPGERKANGT